MRIKWRLRMAAAQREVWTGTELRRLLADKAGLEMSGGVGVGAVHQGTHPDQDDDADRVVHCLAMHSGRLVRDGRHSRRASCRAADPTGADAAPSRQRSRPLAHADVTLRFGSHCRTWVNASVTLSSAADRWASSAATCAAGAPPAPETRPPSSRALTAAAVRCWSVETGRCVPAGARSAVTRSASRRPCCAGAANAKPTCKLATGLASGSGPAHESCSRWVTVQHSPQPFTSPPTPGSHP